MPHSLGTRTGPHPVVCEQDMHGIQVRSIELSAQGSKAVVYSARLIGHPDFSLEATTIRVEPGSSASFAVQCKASTTNPQVCLLLVWGGG